MTSTSKPELTEDLKHEIKLALKNLAVQEHANHNKQMLRDMPGRITLACPVCGDSSKDDTKKRGNVFWDTLQYHCYNCGYHTDVYKLLKDYDIKFSKPGDAFTLIDYIQHKKTQVTQNETLKLSVFERVNELAIELDQFKKTFGAKEIEIGDWVWFKLKERLLHNRSDEFLFSPRDNRLWILNRTNEGKIMAAQSRRMKGYGQRYLTYDLPKLYEEMKIELEATNEEKIKLTKASTLFGIMQVNFQRPVTVFEGPLDAMFMQNTLALATAGRSTEEFDDMQTIRYMFDNDETGKKKMAEKLKRGRQVFMWQKFLADHELDTYDIKDLNDLIIRCFELKSDAYKHINNYFTSSHLDLWYV